MISQPLVGLSAQRSALLWMGSAIAASLLAGLVVSRGGGLLVLSAVVVVAAWAAGIANWRRHVYALLVFLPFSGIPIIALYPHTSVGVLVGDVLFVLPAYAGFATEFMTHRKRITFNGVPITLLSLLAIWVVVQALNPSLPNLLVGLIGIKTWLLYIPLLFLGYHLISSERDLFRVLKVIAVAAIVPVVVGIAQAVLLSSGHSSLVYRPYGAAAAAVSQNFAQFDYGGGTLHRAPSTFSFVTQYYLFTGAMISVAYALWRSAPTGSRREKGGRYLWLLMLAGAFLSGVRGAFLMVPALVVLTVLLERRRIASSIGRIAAPALVLVGGAAAIGVTALDLVRAAFSVAANEMNSIVYEGFRHALRLTWIGLGSGIDSSGARYALPGHTSIESIAGSWNESWYVKTLLELGIPGLCLVVLLVATLVVGGTRQHRLVRDPRLRAVSAAMLAFLVWILANGFKGKYLDLDPANVYFWLFAGMLARTWALDGHGRLGLRGEE